ncbi:MAG: hypothetical protein M1570_15575 [Chloroflexi bacterium]|nr:hypothetical protein [Chloroflexota bacterium]
MARRSKPKTQKRDWRWYASFGLNGLVALSMILGTVLLFTGGSIIQRQPVPTIAVPTISTDASNAGAAATPPAVAPTTAPSAPNQAAPTPTPKVSASNSATTSSPGK